MFVAFNSSIVFSVYGLVPVQGCVTCSFTYCLHLTDNLSFGTTENVATLSRLVTQCKVEHTNKYHHSNPYNLKVQQTTAFPVAKNAKRIP